MPHRRAIHLPPVLGLALALAACGGGPSLSALQMPPAETPAAQSDTLQISTSEAYARIAQGANSCWFGARGRLNGRYIFHADAAPPARGGAVEIVVHERVYDQPKPWGYKAFRVALTKGSGYTSVGVENLRMPEEAARQMRAEVLAWAHGSQSCMRGNVAADPGWMATTPVTAVSPRR
jgi:hypothetical protein